MSLRNELLELVNEKHTGIVESYDRHYGHGYSTIAANIPELNQALEASIDRLLVSKYMQLTHDLVLKLVEPEKQGEAWEAIRKALGVTQVLDANLGE